MPRLADLSDEDDGKVGKDYALPRYQLIRHVSVLLCEWKAMYIIYFIVGLSHRTAVYTSKVP